MIAGPYVGLLLTWLSFYYVIFWHLVAWIYGWVINEKFTKEQPDLDWTSEQFTEGFFVILLWCEFPA